VKFSGAVTLVVAGLMGLTIGLIVAIAYAGLAAREAARVERLLPLTLASLRDLKVGREALIEGHISAQNPALLQDFVAYVREEYRGRGKNRSWVEAERRTPPLLIDLSDGIVALADEPYELDLPAHTWEEPDTQDWLGVPREGARRHYGFRAGDAVLAVGRLAPGRAGLVLRAEWLAGGTRAEYLAARRHAAATLPWYGGSLALAGLLLGGIGVRWIRIGPRSTSSRRQGRQRGRQAGG
jgi:hypothetical protein